MDPSINGMELSVGDELDTAPDCCGDQMVITGNQYRCTACGTVVETSQGLVFDIRP